VTSRFDVVVSVLRHPALRRMAGAFLAFSIGEWATWVAIVIYAYSRGGAAEAGLIAFIQLVPSIIIAPLSIWATGFAIPLPTMSGADPCTGSNIDG